MTRKQSGVVGGLLAFIGLVGSVVQLLTTEGQLRAIAILLVFLGIAAAGAWLIVSGTLERRRAARALPPMEQLEDLGAGYRISPAGPDDIQWIARLEAETYSADDAVPLHVLQEWHEANPDGFSVIRMRNGQKVGHLNLLPVRPATLEKFLQGKILEKEIRGDSLFKSKERAEIRDLYIESIIVLPPKGYSNAPAILCVLTNLHSLVGRLCDPSQVRKIYAMAASSRGDKLLRRLGFEVLSSKTGRADGHDVFQASFAALSNSIGAACESRFPRDASS
jgi:hypothetical protein